MYLSLRHLFLFSVKAPCASENVKNKCRLLVSVSNECHLCFQKSLKSCTGIRSHHSERSVKFMVNTWVIKDACNSNAAGRPPLRHSLVSSPLLPFIIDDDGDDGDDITITHPPCKQFNV